MKPTRVRRLERISRAKIAAVFFVFGFALLWSRISAAEVVIAKKDDWEVFTDGRINAFYSFGFGDALPTANPNIPGEHITPGGGLDTESDVIPKTGPDGMPLVAQGTFRSSRVRSGFVPNVLGTGLRWWLDEETTLKVYVAFWFTIEAEGQRKFNNPFPFAREGYAKLAGPWGGLLVGRALDLFSRGATENDFLYGHGYSLGFPGNINNQGPTAGLIGFGVLAAFFSPGIVYETPQKAGLQLSLGVYDPVVITGYYPATREPLLESEATFDWSRASFKMHLFANGAYQKLYLAASNTSKTMAGVGYGGRLEIGPLHIGLAGHYGNGLGLSYALENSATSITQNGELRTFDGYSALLQYAAGRLDINLGGGVSRVFLAAEDKMPDPNAPNSLIKTQVGISGGLVYHIRNRVHLSLDYLRGQYKWYLGEKQNVNFINTGMTVTW